MICLIVEMFQATIFSYFIFLMLYLSMFSAVNDFKRFFFLSELIWLMLFLCLLGLNLTISNPLVNINCFFILVFTACEAVVLAAILLISSESNNLNLFLKNETL